MKTYVGFVVLGLFTATAVYVFMDRDVAVSEILKPQIPTLDAMASEVPQQAHILVGGDMMFDRTVRSAMEKNGVDFVLSCLDLLFEKPDLVVANLEGPITSHVSMSQNAPYESAQSMTFTFATSTADLLYRHHIRLVNLGNNHILNFSREGVLETKKYLDAAGVKYFGDPDVADSERVARVDIHGVPLSFVNWSDWTSDNTDITAATVRDEVAKGRVVVVYTHWGEEYVPPIPRVRVLAHNFIDEGAAIVIGSHPHIVQENEIYKGKHIYYSLGNLIFDQYFTPEVRQGLILDIIFDKDGVADLKEIPVHLEKDRRTCPLTSSPAAAGAAILDEIQSFFLRQQVPVGE